MKKKIALIIITIIFLIQFMLNTNIAINAVMEGIRLWFYNVMPSLFPFMIFSSILLQLDASYYLQRIFNKLMNRIFNVSGRGTLPLFMGFISGYPLGGKLVGDLRKEDSITAKESYKLLALCSTTGPAFIIGIVSLQMFNNTFIVPILLLANYLGAILNGIFIKRFYKEELFHNNTYEIKNKDFSHILNDAIMSSITSSLKICGYIVFFNLIIKYIDGFGVFDIISNMINSIISLPTISHQLIEGTLYGFFEITLGIYTVSQCSDPLIVKVALTSLLIAWSGFSIHLQTNSFLVDTDIKFTKYLLSKFSQSIISLGVSIIAFIIIKPPVLPVFNNNIILNSIHTYWIYGYLILLVSVVIYICTKLFVFFVYNRN